MIELEIITPDSWQLWRELRLRALEDAPRAFGSRLEDWVEAPEERWRDRLGLPGSHNVIARLNGRPAGMVAGIPGEGPRESTLIALWVAPEARGLRVGDALVAEVTRWAIAQGDAVLGLVVGADNTRAQALYARHRFVPRSGQGATGEVTMVKDVEAAGSRA